MRWTVALVVFFSTIVATNGLFAWLAFSGEEPVDPSYVTEGR